MNSIQEKWLSFHRSLLKVRWIYCIYRIYARGTRHICAYNTLYVPRFYMYYVDRHANCGFLYTFSLSVNILFTSFTNGTLMSLYCNLLQEIFFYWMLKTGQTNIHTYDVECVCLCGVCVYLSHWTNGNAMHFPFLHFLHHSDTQTLHLCRSLYGSYVCASIFAR